MTMREEFEKFCDEHWYWVDMRENAAQIWNAATEATARRCVEIVRQADSHGFPQPACDRADAITREFGLEK